MIDWNETRQRRFLQILILNLKSLIDVEGLNIWGKWGKKFVSPQSAFLVLPENSPYLKKKNIHVIKIYPLLGLKYAAHLSWMLISAKRNERLSDFCLTFVVDVFVLLLLLSCRWLCLYVWRVIKNEKQYNWKRVQYVEISIWIGFGVRADMHNQPWYKQLKLSTFVFWFFDCWLWSHVTH